MKATGHGQLTGLVGCVTGQPGRVAIVETESIKSMIIIVILLLLRYLGKKIKEVDEAKTMERERQLSSCRTVTSEP